MVSSIAIKAPSSTANLGPGFDVFGLALNAFSDKVKVSKKVSGIKIVTSDSIPVNTQKNTAGIVAKKMVKKYKIKSGLEIKIKKGVPPGYGLGSSAASAAATVVAINKLFKLNLDPTSLVRLAGYGEKASAGTVHYDNVAAAILGGFVIVRTKPLDIIQIKPPRDLVLCLAIPKIEVPTKKTKISRSVIPHKINIEDSITNLSNAAAIVAGFLKKNSIMIGTSVKDIIVEPARQRMIPGFAKVKRDAINAGALGVTISGAGPSVIAFTTKSANSKKICNAMSKSFASSKTRCNTIICKPSKGASITKF